MLSEKSAKEVTSDDGGKTRAVDAMSDLLRRGRS